MKCQELMSFFWKGMRTTGWCLFDLKDCHYPSSHLLPPSRLKPGIWVLETNWNKNLHRLQRNTVQKIPMVTASERRPYPPLKRSKACVHPFVLSKGQEIVQCAQKLNFRLKILYGILEQPSNTKCVQYIHILIQRTSGDEDYLISTRCTSKIQWTSTQHLLPQGALHLQQNYFKPRKFRLH